MPKTNSKVEFNVWRLPGGHDWEILPMNGTFKWILGLAAAAMMCFAPLAIAQAQEDQFVQVKLTDQQIKGYLAASKKLAAISEKIEAGGDKPDPKLLDELEAVAKANGFKSYDELDTVISNISFVLSGFDDKGNFTDPHDALKAELEQVKGDTSMKADEKAKMVKEIEEAMKTTPPLKYKENVALVKSHLKELDEILQKQ